MKRSSSSDTLLISDSSWCHDKQFNEWRLSQSPSSSSSQCGIFNLVKELVKAEKLKKAKEYEDEVIIISDDESMNTPPSTPPMPYEDDDDHNHNQVIDIMDSPPRTPPYPRPEEEEYVLATVVHNDNDIHVADIVVDNNLPLKKRKTLDSPPKKPQQQKKRIGRRRRCKKTQYNIDFEKNVLYPKYRVALYDQFLVKESGIRPGRIVKLKSWSIDDPTGNILWDVSSLSWNGVYEEEWTENEDHLLLL